MVTLYCKIITNTNSQQKQFDMLHLHQDPKITICPNSSHIVELYMELQVIFLTKKFRGHLFCPEFQFFGIRKPAQDLMSFYTISYLLFWPASIWRIFLEKKHSAGCLLKTKWQMKICEFSRQITMLIYFISQFVFRRQPAESFFSNKIRQMKAGQN